MDPLMLKLLQLILVSVFGMAAIVGGFILFIKNISGKSTIIVNRGDVGAKITNASPGVFLTIAGILILYWSVNKNLEKETHSKETQSGENTLDQWLTNSMSINDSTTYSALINDIVPTGGFDDRNIILKKELTLGEIADSLYHSGKYWKLIAAINKDRGYYSLSSAIESSKIPTGSVVEYFLPAKYEHFVQRDELLKIRGSDMKKVYEVLMYYSDTSSHILELSSLQQMENWIKTNYEVSIGYQDVALDENYTLGELSMKYYQDKKYSKIIVSFNTKTILPHAEASTILKKETRLFVPFVLP